MMQQGAGVIHCDPMGQGKRYYCSYDSNPFEFDPPRFYWSMKETDASRIPAAELQATLDKVMESVPFARATLYVPWVLPVNRINVELVVSNLTATEKTT